MIVNFEHENYRAVELKDGSLILQPHSGENKILQETVNTFALTMQGQRLKLVSFSEQNYAWFFSGTDELSKTRIELAQTYGGGGLLISDQEDRLHLFYLVKQRPGSGYILWQQTFTDSWSTPILVSTNVFAGPASFTVASDGDHFLHLAYLSSQDQSLLYRVYDLKNSLWSGAIPFTKEGCSFPQFVIADRLALFWQEEETTTNLKMRIKEKTWSSSKLISSGEHHVTNVGYSFRDSKWSVLWREANTLYQVSFDNLSQKEAIEDQDWDYSWLLTEGSVLPFYYLDYAEEEVELEITGEDKETLEQVKQIDYEEQITSAREKEKEKEKERELQAQMAFLEQAFRILPEWESMKAEVASWQRQLQSQKPEPVNLDPVLARLESLERRYLRWQQQHEQKNEQGKNMFKQTETELRHLKFKVQNLEKELAKDSLSLWQRMLRRRS